MKTEQKKRGVSYKLVDKVEFYDPLNYEEHLRYFGELAIRISCENKDRSGEGSALENLGIVYKDLGKVEEAIEYFEQAYKIFIEIKSPNAQQVKQRMDELRKSNK